MMENKKKQEDINHSLKLIVKSSLFVFIGVLLSKILTYVYRILISKLGPEVYGLFSLSIIVLLWFGVFFSFGLYEGILRFISLYRGKNEINKIRYVFRASTIFLSISGIIAGIILYFLSHFIAVNILHSPDLIVFLQIISLSIPFYMLSFGFLSVIQAYENIKAHSFISDVLRNLINVVTLAIFVFIGFKTNSVILSYFLGILVLFFSSFIYCKHHIPEVFIRPKINESLKKSIRKDIIHYSLPFIFSGVIYELFVNLDSLVIGYFNGAIDVGYYNIAILLASFLAIAPMLFTKLLFPLITKEFSLKNFDSIKTLSKQVEKWILAINLPLCLLIILFPGAVINLLFGAEYIIAETSLRILGIGMFLYSMSTVMENLISMIGKSKVLMVNVFIAAVVNLILNIILVPRYGMVGAAISTMLMYLILSITLFFQVKHYIGIIPLKRDMLRVFFSIIPPTLLLLLIKNYIPVNLCSILLQGLFFVLTYILLIFITRGIDKNDLMILGAIKKKLSYNRSINNTLFNKH